MVACGGGQLAVEGVPGVVTVGAYVDVYLVQAAQGHLMPRDLFVLPLLMTMPASLVVMFLAGGFGLGGAVVVIVVCAVVQALAIGGVVRLVRRVWAAPGAGCGR